MPPNPLSVIGDARGSAGITAAAKLNDISIKFGDDGAMTECCLIAANTAAAITSAIESAGK